MKKVIYQNQFEVFEKVVSRNGRLFLVSFVVVEREGKLRGRVLSYEAIQTLAGTTETHEVTYLPSVTFAEEAPISRRSFYKLVSPYFTLDFLTSIQIRAPAFSF